MTEEEIRSKIDELENAKFVLDMKDRWNTTDWNTSRRLSFDIRQLKEKLEGLKNA